MKKQTLVSVSAALLLLAACAPAEGSGAPPPDTVVTSPATSDPITSVTPLPPVYEPKPGDANLQQSQISIGQATIVLRESYPVQVAVELKGELPTPCHQLRAVVSLPDVDNKIEVEAYSVVNPQVNCTQVVKPFQQLIELGTFPSGHYTVWVNGLQVGEFDS
jgi:hypothetical protein